MNDDRIDFHLWNWSQWMQRGETSHLEHRNSASSGIGKSGSSTFDEMCDRADSHCAEATNVAIDDLPKNDKCAVYFMHLEKDCDLPEAAIKLYYRAACIEVGRKLDRAGIV